MQVKILLALVVAMALSFVSSAAARDGTAVSRHGPANAARESSGAVVNYLSAASSYDPGAPTMGLPHRSAAVRGPMSPVVLFGLIAFMLVVKYFGGRRGVMAKLAALAALIESVPGRCRTAATWLHATLSSHSLIDLCRGVMATLTAKSPVGHFKAVAHKVSSRFLIGHNHHAAKTGLVASLQ